MMKMGDEFRTAGGRKAIYLGPINGNRVVFKIIGTVANAATEHIQITDRDGNHTNKCWCILIPETPEDWRLPKEKD